MRLRLVLLFLLAAAAISGWQAEARAALQLRLLLRSLTVQLEPFGSLSYGATQAHFWSRGHIQDLRFVPTDALRTQFALPSDFALHIPMLHYRDWQPGEGWPQAMRLRFEVATLPLPAPWPTVSSGTLDWRHATADGALHLAITLKAPDYAAVESSLSLQHASPKRLAGATLLSGTLRYHDLGLAQGHRAALAATLGADPLNAEAAFANALTQWLSNHGLPPDSALRSRLATFAQDPLHLTLRLDPPGALRPDTLPQFAPADRIAALGLSSSE